MTLTKKPGRPKGRPTELIRVYKDDAERIRARVKSMQEDLTDYTQAEYVAWLLDNV